MLPSCTQSMLFVVTIALLFVSKTYVKPVHPHCTCKKSLGVGSTAGCPSTSEPEKQSDQGFSEESDRGRLLMRQSKSSRLRRRQHSLNARLSRLEEIITESESEDTESTAETIVPANVPATRRQARQLPRSCSQLEVSQADESTATDGETFRSILTSQGDPDHERASKLWLRLSPRKQRNLRALMKHDNLCQAFNALSPFVGFWTDLKIGNLHKLLATHAYEVRAP